MQETEAEATVDPLKVSVPARAPTKERPRALPRIVKPPEAARMEALPPAADDRTRIPEAGLLTETGDPDRLIEPVPEAGRVAIVAAPRDMFPVGEAEAKGVPVPAKTILPARATLADPEATPWKEIPELTPGEALPSAVPARLREPLAADTLAAAPVLPPKVREAVTELTGAIVAAVPERERDAVADVAAFVVTVTELLTWVTLLPVDASIPRKERVIEVPVSVNWM
jgi:hypothetical protein